MFLNSFNLTLLCVFMLHLTLIVVSYWKLNPATASLGLRLMWKVTDVLRETG